MQPEKNDGERYQESPAMQLAPELAELAASLAALAPAAARLDRDRLMYEAGRRAAAPAGRRPAAWLWPLSTAALTLVSLGLAGALLIERGGDATLARGVAPPRPPAISGLADGATGGKPSSPTDVGQGAKRVAVAAPAGMRTPLAAQSYFELRDVILSQGVEALPSAPLPSTVKTAPFRWRDGRRNVLGG